MASVNKPQASKSRIHQVIKLKQVFGYTPNEAQKRLFYNEAVDHIVRRTTKGNDRFNKKFQRYTKDYAANKGVTRSSVDLVLTGKMLDSFESSINKNNLKLNIRPDQTAKAYGHISGFKGHRYIKNGPVRDFFGINEKEAEKIKKKVENIAPPGDSNSGPATIASEAVTASELRALFEGISVG